MTERDRLVLDPIAADAEVGRWLAALQDARRRTLREVDGLDPSLVDRVPTGPLPSIGSLLYHIGLIEADWVAADILGLDEPPELVALLPWPDRDERGALTVVEGIPLADHLERLAAIRAFTLRRLGGMSATEFRTPRVRARYDVAPDWTIHHLLQHEAEHRTHIAYIRDTSDGGER